MELASLLLVAFFSCFCHKLDAQSINSPRGSDFDRTLPKKSGSENNNNNGHVLVKLPHDLEAHLNYQKNDRARINAAILGVSPDHEHLDKILNDDRTNSEAVKNKVFIPEETSTYPPPEHPDIQWTRKPPPNQPSRTNLNSTTKKSSYSPPIDPNKEIIKPQSEVPEKSLWWIAWECHIYFTATIFVFLAICCITNVLRLHTFSRLFSRDYYLGLNGCIIVVGIIRSVYLFYDPYNEGSSFPRVASYILLDTGLPCISTAFAILFLALLRATQVEILSPSFQRPRSLVIFCSVHFLISFSVDITVAFLPNLRYLILIGQGFFIVWTLLLAAGYIFAFNYIKKVAIRTRGDFRSVYPKLTMNSGAYFEADQSPNSQSRINKKTPLAKAAVLTLWVAFLASLMGGIELFGMIKMVGLQKEDLRNESYYVPWYGFQVSMRVLEMALCTLFAIIATIPLRWDEEQEFNSNNSTSIFGILCCKKRNSRQDLDDEIYTEICSNNQSVRQMMQINQRNDGVVPIAGGYIDPNDPYGTLRNQNILFLNQQQGLIPIDPNQQQQLQLSTGANIINTATVNSMGSSSSNPNSTLRSGATPRDGNRGSMASSRATLETALYSNVRSRPSSMLFNDSGFVRFRSSNDPGLPQDEILKRSTHDLISVDDNISPKKLSLSAKREKLRSSQSFDDSVLLVESRVHNSNAVSPSSDLTPFNQNDEEKYLIHDRPGTRSPVYKMPEENEGIYEPPPGMNLPPVSQISNRPGLQHNIYSESDIESNYNKSQIYSSSRAPSQCSSISATQSFDMRMYGKVKPHASEDKNQQQKFISTTLKRNEEAKEKLENPYYYYGSTRNQKKVKQQLLQQKPRPLLPSQRAQMESQARQEPGRHLSRPQSRDDHSRPSSRQTLAQESFQRSRSLGGYYNRGGNQVPLGPSSGPMAPMRNQQFMRQPVGSMTPVSYSRWQHDQLRENIPKRNNPLYDTPPTARHAHNAMMAHFRMEQGSPRLRIDPSGDSRSQQQYFTGPHPHPRNINNLRNRHIHSEQLLSPILTDQEESPVHNAHPLSIRGQEFVVGDSDSETDGPSNMDAITSQATHGYSEGLADESEVSSMFSGNDQADPRSQRNLRLLSPLEYSAKFRNQNPNGSNKIHSKDITPDSGVAMENTTDSNRSKKSEDPLNLHKNALRSSSSSSLNEMPNKKSNNFKQGASGYSRVSTKDEEIRMHANTVFSSSSESDESEETDAGKNHLFSVGQMTKDRMYHPLASPPSSTEHNFRKEQRKMSSDSYSADNDGEDEDEEDSDERQKVIDTCKQIQMNNFVDRNPEETI